MECAMMGWPEAVMYIVFAVCFAYVMGKYFS